MTPRRQLVAVRLAELAFLLVATASWAWVMVSGHSHGELLVTDVSGESLVADDGEIRLTPGTAEFRYSSGGDDHRFLLLSANNDAIGDATGSTFNLQPGRYMLSCVTPGHESMRYQVLVEWRAAEFVTIE